MQKNFLVIGIIIVIIVLIASYIITINKNSNSNDNNLLSQSGTVNNEANNNMVNLNDNENPKDLVSLLDIPTPDSIVFYHNSAQKTFVKGSDEFNEIIMLNNKRDSGRLDAIKQYWAGLDYYLKDNDMLEYTYKGYDSIYFNLVKDEQLKIDNTISSWVSVRYNSKIFNPFMYVGLLSSDDLINYLYSLK